MAINKNRSPIRARFMASALALTLALTPICGPAYTAFAEEAAEQPAEQPAEALESYEVDGITYYNVYSPNFENPSYYLTDLISTKSAVMGDRSMKDLWAMLALGIFDANYERADLSKCYPLLKEALESDKGVVVHGDIEHLEDGFTEIAVDDAVFSTSWRQAFHKLRGTELTDFFATYLSDDQEKKL